MSNEVVLPKRVIQQPSPKILDKGDPGACALGGLLDLHIEQVYVSAFGEPKPFSFESVAKFAQRMVLNPVRVGVDSIVVDSNLHKWGQVIFERDVARWFKYCYNYLLKGHYGLPMVQETPASRIVDHFLLIVGAREPDELLVSCPSPKTEEEEWVSAYEFLNTRGGSPIIFLRLIG